jgi:hypothetical protein
VAKATALLGYLVAVKIIAVPAFVLLLLGPPIANVANLIALLPRRHRDRDRRHRRRAGDPVTRARPAGPLIALPLLLPVLICAAKGPLRCSRTPAHTPSQRAGR